MSDFLSILRSRNQDVTPAAVGAGSI
jgi:hypothetical protein